MKEPVGLFRMSDRWLVWLCSAR